MLDWWARSFSVQAPPASEEVLDSLTASEEVLDSLTASEAARGNYQRKQTAAALDS